MKTELELLIDDATAYVDCQLDYSKPESKALDKLMSCVQQLAHELNELRRSTQHASYVASCLANGIKPD